MILLCCATVMSLRDEMVVYRLAITGEFRGRYSKPQLITAPSDQQARCASPRASLCYGANLFSKQKR